MTDIQTTAAEVRAPDRFDPVGAGLGVLVHPVRTMATIAAARPWRVALGLAILVALLQALANLTAPPPALPADTASLPPGAASTFESFVTLSRSPLWVAVQVLVLSPVFLAIVTAVFSGVGHLLGGRGPFSALFSALAFASVPSLLAAPILAWLRLGGLGGVAGPVGFAFGLWSLVLQVLGIRAALGLSTGRAVATVLLPLLILVVLAIVLGIVVALLAFGALAGRGG
jgi:hypothetical protein